MGAFNLAEEHRNSDRTVHAFGDSAEVVRYEQAGKWFIEFKGWGIPCQQVKIDEAVRKAIWLWNKDNGSVNFGRPGGSVFDRKVRAVIGND